MSFLERILARLAERPDHPFLQEARDTELAATTGAELLAAVGRVRAFVRQAGLTRGDRCALLGSNSVAWAAADLGLLADGVLAVPLYERQTPRELTRILEDCRPGLLLAADAEAARAMIAGLAAPPAVHALAEVTSGAEPADAAPVAVGPSDPVTIIYTSGTSGEPKGVVLTRGNVDFLLERVSARLDLLLEGCREVERVYHYLPWCFAGAWIALLAGLQRGATMGVNTDLGRIVDDLQLVRPHWFQNVPVVLERIRAGVEQGVHRRGGWPASFLRGAFRATLALADGRRPRWRDGVQLTVARRTLFPSIRKRLGTDLRALVCGSAPLHPETQLFFEMLDVPVLQVYGLTETTAICTMDVPGRVQAGKVGPAIEGVEIRLGEDDEILVRGPNVFAGYWNRSDATESALTDGWFHTGDRGEVDESGRWRILGRLKNLIVLGSGHNVAPEPIERELASRLPAARQILLAGNGRRHVVAIITGKLSAEEVEAVLVRLNEELPHYQRIQGSVVLPEPFTIESGLVTANGKLRRDAIAAALASEIDELYRDPEDAG